MIRRFSLAFVTTMLLAASPVLAQNWVKVAQFTTEGSSGYFFNANEGVIGTGSYQTGSAMQMYFTLDGGTTWRQSILPNMQLFGQVTDIEFTDRMNGWATLKEENEHGWSGLYHSIDGGMSWTLVQQMEFPVAVRMMQQGLIVTDRMTGVKLSTDGGRSFALRAQSTGSLGLDVISPLVGYASGEALFNSWHFRTVDGGFTWQIVNQPYESWGVFGDRATKAIYYASEKDNAGTPKFSTVSRSIDNGATFTSVWSTPAETLAGGIAGSRGCESVVYTQGGPSATVSGLNRTTDNGATWVPIGGPNTFVDKRFVVTGRGAVVYAFDRAGGIWKTSNGGDGKLSPRVMNRVRIQPIMGSIVSAKNCDTLFVPYLLSASICDSLSIQSIVAFDDNQQETSIDLKRDHPFGNGVIDTLRIRYTPQDEQSKTIHYRVRLMQPDGFVEDTTLVQVFQGLPGFARVRVTADSAPANTIGSIDTLNFGERSICASAAYGSITLSNFSCATAEVLSITMGDSTFSLRSNFSRFPLDAGAERRFLIQFHPRAIGSNQTQLIVQTSIGYDTLVLLGAGVGGTNTLSVQSPAISASLCDSTDATIVFRNLSCSPISIDSITLAGNSLLLAPYTRSTLAVDSASAFVVHFVPTSSGTVTTNVTIHSHAGATPFDTTIVLTALGVDQGSAYALSRDTIDLGNVSICNIAGATATIHVLGCDAVTIDSVGSGSLASGVTVTGPHATLLPRGGRDSIHVVYVPSSVGSMLSIVHIYSTATGPKQLVVRANVISDAGSIALDAVDSATLTCKSTGFFVTLHNTTCDTIAIDSITLSGTNASEFILDPANATSVARDSSFILHGFFEPQSVGVRTATITYHLIRHDGTRLDTSIVLSAAGIAASPIRFALVSVPLHAPADAQIDIPIYAWDSSLVPVDHLSFTIALNTDLLTPLTFLSSDPSIRVTAFTVSRDLLTVSLSVQPVARISKGLIGTIACHVQLTDTMRTIVALNAASATDSVSPSNCLTTLALDSTIQFTLDVRCGDSTIVAKLASRLIIESIVPNPATGEITLHCSGVSDFDQNAEVSIENTLGVVEQRTRVQLSHGASDVHVKLSGESGIRYVRLRTASTVETRRILFTH